ncbi:DUF1876 domain-containing protein [Streptomyces orinoci]|uniref:DUF1876 domain-containing protein n=1 Tax=Streptomyces orinoci TaxID=67339 RepID=A0ABV3JXJ6_STRON|nr:DUF1876 domain-containing protein [Streptomyces orinoci]
MTGTKSWSVHIDIKEHDHTVTAEARLSGKTPGPIVGEGTARCNPADENVPDIGDELSVARALNRIADQLLDKTIKDIESHTHEPVRGLRA